MAATTYTAGTVSVSNGSTSVTGSGTLWAANIQAGDRFWAGGYSVRIASVNSNTSITLAYAWPGTTLSGANYECIYTTENTRVLAAAREAITYMSNGNLYSIAQLTTAADKITYYTGAGTSALLDFKSWARSFLGAADAAAGRTALGLGSIATAAAPSGTVVGTTGAQTLSNKSFSTSVTISISGNTPSGGADYLKLATTDYGVGVPYFFISKAVVAGRWNIGLWDGTTNGVGDLNFQSAVQFAGSTFTLPPIIPSYTVSTLPSAATYARGLIYVSNGTSNKRLAISDGTNWRFPDGTIVS